MIKVSTQKKKLQCNDRHKREARKVKKQKKEDRWSSNDKIK